MNSKMFTLFFGPAIGFNAFAGAPDFNAGLIAKLNQHVSDCRGSGMEPKPGFAQLIEYLKANGFQDAQIECGVSNLEEREAPTVLIHSPSLGEFWINFELKKKQGWRVKNVINDAETPEGMKRLIRWPKTPTKTK